MSEDPDSVKALASIEECARLLDDDHPDLAAFRRALATVRAHLNACKKDALGAVDDDTKDEAATPVTPRSSGTRRP